MAYSQNGWAVDLTGDLQDRATVHGVAFPNGVRRGNAATVLFEVAARFHREVEPLIPGSCWGWYVKNIEGGSSISNHASGTAIDLNAPKHPLGARGTFSSAQRAAIRKIIDDCDGVIRWGGDYSGRADEMHWEIVGSSSEVATLARKITGRDDMSVEDVEAGYARATSTKRSYMLKRISERGWGDIPDRLLWEYTLEALVAAGSGDVDGDGRPETLALQARLERLEDAVRANRDTLQQILARLENPPGT